jgi:hypothetical protein
MICPRCHKSTVATGHGLLLNETCCWRCVGIDELADEITRLTTENDEMKRVSVVVENKILIDDNIKLEAENIRLTTELKMIRSEGMKAAEGRVAEIATLESEVSKLKLENSALRAEKKQIIENDGRECQHCQNLPENAARKERQEMRKENKELRAKLAEIQYQCVETTWVHEERLRAYIAGVINETIPERAWSGKHPAAPVVRLAKPNEMPGPGERLIRVGINLPEVRGFDETPEITPEPENEDEQK